MQRWLRQREQARAVSQGASESIDSRLARHFECHFQHLCTLRNKLSDVSCEHCWYCSKRNWGLKMWERMWGRIPPAFSFFIPTFYIYSCKRVSSTFTFLFRLLVSCVQFNNHLHWLSILCIFIMAWNMLFTFNCWELGFAWLCHQMLLRNTESPRSCTIWYYEICFFLAGV